MEHLEKTVFLIYACHRIFPSPTMQPVSPFLSGSTVANASMQGIRGHDNVLGFG